MLDNLMLLIQYSSNKNNGIFNRLGFLLSYMCHNNFPCISIQKVNRFLEIQSIFFDSFNHRLNIDQYQNIRMFNKYCCKSKKGKMIKTKVVIQQNWFYIYIKLNSIFLYYYRIQYIHLLLVHCNCNSFDGKFCILELSFRNTLKCKDIYYWHQEDL